MELVERSMSLGVLVVLGLMVNQYPAVEASRIPARVCNGSCRRIFLPVCGTDGGTYSNECGLDHAACQHPEADIRVQHKGYCGSVDRCIEGRIEPAEDGCNTCTCIGGELRQCTEKYCPGQACDRACRKILDPVCGTDGLTYGNDCALDIAACKHPEADIRVQHKGYCDSGDRCIEGNITPVEDGCNTCKCIGGERIKCTEKNCPGQGASVRPDGRCGPRFLAPNGRMVQCNQNNGNCCMITEYCGGWNCQAEWN